MKPEQNLQKRYIRLKKKIQGGDEDETNIGKPLYESYVERIVMGLEYIETVLKRKE